MYYDVALSYEKLKAENNVSNITVKLRGICFSSDIF